MHGETEPAPAVDFETASVLAVCSWLSDPGVSLEITTFEAAATHLTAYVTKVSQCGAHPQVIVFGYHALRIDGVFESADFQHQRKPALPHQATAPVCSIRMCSIRCGRLRAIGFCSSGLPRLRFLRQRFIQPIEDFLGDVEPLVGLVDHVAIDALQNLPGVES